MVFPDGRAVFAGDKLLGNTGPHHLGKPVNVGRVNTAASLDRLAHGVGPGLGPKDAQTQRQRLGIHSLALHLVGNVQHVGRGHHDDVRLEILHQLDLLFGLPPGHGNNCTAQLLSAVVGTEPAGEQSVTVGHLNAIAGAPTRCLNGTGHTGRPMINVFTGIAHHRGLACGATGRVDPCHLLTRHAKQPERIVLPEILLGSEGKPGEIAEVLKIIWCHTLGVKTCPMYRRRHVDVLKCCPQPLQLQRMQLIPRQFAHGVEESVWPTNHKVTLYRATTEA